MDIRPNEGDRPSKLAIARRAAGEISGEIPPDIAAELAQAGGQVRPFDAGAIRARAAGVGETWAEPGRPANTWRWLVTLVAIAAVGMVATLAVVNSDPAPVRPDIGVRGAQRMMIFQLDGDRLTPWDGRPLAAGDVVGVRVRPEEASGVVVLSVDGAGDATVFWPESGTRAEPVPSGDWTALPGTVVLDGAPGPEVFVVLFDTSPTEALGDARRAWAEGGAESVMDWAETVGDSVLVERR